MNFSTTRNCSSGTTSSNNQNDTGGRSHLPTIKYVYDIPFFERKEICRIFDENNQWEALGGGLMGYSGSELSEFGRAVFRGASPTDALLTSWGNQNHTILELFTLFGKLLHYRGMKILAKYVDPKYHTFIRDPDFQATQELVGIDPPIAPLLAEVKPQNVLPEKNKSPVEKEAKNKGDLEDKSKSANLADSVGLLPQIPYEELLTATNNWDRRNMLGKGGFGTVYKGMWKNTAVAIKRMEQQRPNQAYVDSQMKQSLGELKFLNSHRHDNILPLYGFSLEGDNPCLVYQFMTHGSLEDRLLCRQRTSPLSWHLRFQIAKGVACGIQFLHSITPPLIHGDIKSANILLDRNFEAKVGDFGLAREMAQPSTVGASYVKVSRVHGTRPYLPDEYLRSKKLSTKVDTYSFGIVLYELATGQRAYEENRPKKFLKDLIEDNEGTFDVLKDAKGGPDNPDVFYILMKLGRNCVEKLAKNRPEMVQVLKNLEVSVPLATQSSIRTFSTHMTGLPYLFESPYSRPGSLHIPGSNSTTHRLSPEMRAGSPYWMSPPQGYTYNGMLPGNGNQPQQPYGGPQRIWESNVSSMRRSPQPSPPLGHFGAVTPNSQLPSPVMTPNFPPEPIHPAFLDNNIPVRPVATNIPPQSVTSSGSSNANNGGGPYNSNNINNNNTPLAFSNLSGQGGIPNNNTPPNNHNLLMLNVDTSFASTFLPPQQSLPPPGMSKQVLPEVVLVQPSPVPTDSSGHSSGRPGSSPIPNINNDDSSISGDENKQASSGTTVEKEGQNKRVILPPAPLYFNQQPEDIDDMYLPLVLDQNATPSVCTPDGEGPATVIPLITELGIKDSTEDQ